MPLHPEWRRSPGVILSLVKSGDHIVAPESGYPTTQNLLRHIERFGIETTFVDGSDAEAYRAAMRPNTRLFWIESPSNPLLFVTDLAAVAAIAKENGITTVADNTFATPFNQRPLELGIDAVVHSATKYLGGHSDLDGGCHRWKRGDHRQRTEVAANKFYGGNIAPQVAWLVLRGIKTLALRMERHNAERICYSEYVIAARQGKADILSRPRVASGP